MIGAMIPTEEDTETDVDKRLSMVDEALVAGTIANTNGLLVILAKLVARGVFDGDDLKAFSESYSKPLDHEGIRLLITDLNRFYSQNRFLCQSDYDQQSFQWINAHDANSSVLSLVRFGRQPEEVLLVVANFTPVPRPAYRVGVPREGLWVEVLNTNSQKYGGTGEGNPQAVKSNPIRWDGRPHAIDLSLPGMTTLFFLLAPPPAAPDELPATVGETEDKTTSPFVSIESTGLS